MDNDAAVAALQGYGCIHNMSPQRDRLRGYAAQCDHVTELGTGCGYSTLCFLSAGPKTLLSYDLHPFPRVEEFKIWAGTQTDFQHIQGDSLQIELAETDLLFIDTYHTYNQLIQELERHHTKVRKFIIMDDTAGPWGERGEDGQRGLRYAVENFVRGHEEWRVVECVTTDNGLTVLGRIVKDAG